MDRLHTVMGWPLGEWARIKTWHDITIDRHGNTRPTLPPSLLGAERLRRIWIAEQLRPVSVVIGSQLPPPDFAWASFMLSNVIKECQQFRANVGQEKGAGDSSSPTP